MADALVEEDPPRVLILLVGEVAVSWQISAHVGAVARAGASVFLQV